MGVFLLHVLKLQPVAMLVSDVREEFFFLARLINDGIELIVTCFQVR